MTVHLTKTADGHVDKYVVKASDISVNSDDTVLKLTFTENLGFVTLPGFSFPVEVLVDLETYEGGNVDAGSIAGNIVTLDLGAGLIAQSSININFGINYKLGGQTGTPTGTFSAAQICNHGKRLILEVPIWN